MKLMTIFMDMNRVVETMARGIDIPVMINSLKITASMMRGEGKSPQVTHTRYKNFDDEEQGTGRQLSERPKTNDRGEKDTNCQNQLRFSI